MKQGAFGRQTNHEGGTVPVPQPAYRGTAVPAHVPARRSRVEVLPGSRRSSRKQGNASSSIVILARSIAVILVVIAVVCCVRIALTSATVTTMRESDELSTQIAEARSVGTGFEMEQSGLTSTSVLKGAAKRMGMTTPYEVGAIALPADVVATDADGNLSFSGTIHNVIGAAE